MIFLVLSRKMVFFSLDGKWKVMFLKKHGNIMFSLYMYKGYKYDITRLQKKSKMIFSQKNTRKGN